jgi:regulator of sigma E protease
MSDPFVIQLLGFIAGIAVLIIIHELGHFAAARLFHIEVEEFGIGFPPRITKLFEAGGTEFTLNWIPLGGFVRPKGENDPEVEGGLAAANPWVRLAVLFAGPFTNILLGVLLAIILFYNMGEPIPNRVEIQDVSPGSPAAEAGLRPGDMILQLNNQDIKNVDQLHNLIYENLGQPLTFEYQRGNQIDTVTLVPRDPPPEDGAIGILMGYATRPISIAQAIPKGVNMTAQYTRSVLLLPVNIIKGNVSAEQGRPVGFKGMFDVYQQISNPIWFFMVITMSLGIFNLFPIPALDGGRIVLTLPEIFLNRRVPPHLENVIHLVGFTVLILLLIYINLQDFINPVQLP